MKRDELKDYNIMDIEYMEDERLYIKSEADKVFDEMAAENRELKRIEKRFKQAACNHSAYRMLPIWGGLFGVCWECTQCGAIKQKLEAAK